MGVADGSSLPFAPVQGTLETLGVSFHALGISVGSLRVFCVVLKASERSS
jgi:hypothetical protein